MANVTHRNPHNENGRRQLERYRSNTSGTPVTFRGVTLFARAEEVSGAEAGQQGVERGDLKQFVANTDPHVIKFNASDFAPWVDRALPDIGERIVYSGWVYEITAVTPDTANYSAFGIRCAVLKMIYPSVVEEA